MADASLFPKTYENESMLINFYFDDPLHFCKNETKINEVIDIRKEHFEVKNLVEIKHHLRNNIDIH